MKKNFYKLVSLSFMLASFLALPLMVACADKGDNSDYHFLMSLMRKIQATATGKVTRVSSLPKNGMKQKSRRESPGIISTGMRKFQVPIR